jgi:hypothetical protein
MSISGVQGAGNYNFFPGRDVNVASPINGRTRKDIEYS